MSALNQLNQWQIGTKSGEMGSTGALRLTEAQSGRDRRQYRRHDLETRSIKVDRCDSGASDGARKVTFGRLVDLSAGGVRIRTTDASVHPDQQIRVRLELPAYAGICPFIDARNGDIRPSREWVGWMAVSRVIPAPNGEFDVAGRLMDMEEMDRGMLGLYLSTQPAAA